MLHEEKRQCSHCIFVFAPSINIYCTFIIYTPHSDKLLICIILNFHKSRKITVHSRCPHTRPMRNWRRFWEPVVEYYAEPSELPACPQQQLSPTNISAVRSNSFPCTQDRYQKDCHNLLCVNKTVTVAILYCPVLVIFYELGMWHWCVVSTPTDNKRRHSSVTVSKRRRWGFGRGTM